MERQLSSCLTQACEAGKAEIVGFSWLTHEVDYARFPESLQVTWIFVTEAQRALAIGQGQGARMQVLTRAALAEAGIDMDALIAPVRFDSEEACKRTDEVCTSCGRTKDEIRKWKRMKRSDKKATVERAAQRLKALKKKKKK